MTCNNRVIFLCNGYATGMDACYHNLVPLERENSAQTKDQAVFVLIHFKIAKMSFAIIIKS